MPFWGQDESIKETGQVMLQIQGIEYKKKEKKNYQPMI